MKRKHHEWSERELEVSRIGSGARIIKTAGGEPQNEDTITFHDPYEDRPLTGVVRLATGYFDEDADGIMYQITVDIDRSS